MPINVFFDPSANVVGPAAYSAGLGQFEQEEQARRLREAQFQELQRQFDVQQSSRDRSLDAQIANMQHGQGIDNERLRLAKYGVMQQGPQASAERAARFYAQQQAQDFSMAEDAAHMQFQAGMRQADQAEAAARDQQQYEHQQALLAARADAELRNDLLQKSPAAFVGPEQLTEAQNQIQQNQQALVAPYQQGRQQLLNAIQRGDPEAIQAGVQQGILQFSPEQKTQIRQLQEAMAKLGNDPRFSPNQRVNAERMLAEQLHSIRPMMVPPDQQPLSPMEQFHQEVLEITQDVQAADGGKTTFPMQYQKKVRNGVASWEPTEFSMAKLKAHLDIENEKQKIKLEQELGLHPNKVREAQFDAAIEALKARKPDRKDFTDSMEDSKTYGKFDKDEFNKALDDWEAKFNALATQFYADGAVGGPKGGAGDVWRPGQEPPVFINDESDIQRLGLKTGTRVVDANGRTGTVE